MEFWEIVMIVGGLGWALVSAVAAANRKKKQSEEATRQRQERAAQNRALESREATVSSRRETPPAYQPSYQPAARPAPQPASLPQKPRAGQGVVYGQYDDRARQQNPGAAHSQRAQPKKQGPPNRPPAAKPVPAAEQDAYATKRGSQSAVGNREDLVRGVIMSEILGPPKSLRQNSRSMRHRAG